MATRLLSICIALLAGSMLAGLAFPAIAADVTPERLLNPDREPQNWLMNHRSYDGQRFSPLARINRDNVKNLRLAYAVPLGGGAGNEFIQATPLAEDGFLYITDSWGVLYKIDGTSGEVGRIVWRMDPKQENVRQAQPRRRALGQPCHHAGQPPSAGHRHRQRNRSSGVGDERHVRRVPRWRNTDRRAARRSRTRS